MVDVSFCIFTPPDVFSWPFFCNGEDKPFEAMSGGRSRGFVFHAASCLFPSLLSSLKRFRVVVAFFPGALIL